MLVSAQTISFSRPRGFIVLEGVNGAGKSTLQRRLCDFVTAYGRIPKSTFEPGDTALGQELRKILLQWKGDPLRGLTEAFLFSADRHEHVKRVIEPALAAGEVVICDRFYYSTVAFQGYGRELPVEELIAVSRLAIDGLIPDLVLLLDLDPAEGLKRNRRSSKGTTFLGKDSFEKEELAFHTRLRAGFLEMAKSFPEKFVVIDAGQGPDAVFAAAEEAVAKLLGALGQACR